MHVTSQAPDTLEAVNAAVPNFKKLLRCTLILRRYLCLIKTQKFKINSSRRNVYILCIRLGCIMYADYRNYLKMVCV